MTPFLKFFRKVAKHPNPSVPIVYKDKKDFINQRIQPYLDRHQHLKGYIRSYAQDRAKQLEGTITESLENPSTKHGTNQHTTGVDNINSSKTKGGTSQDYLARRLARDNPEILDEIGEGKKFKSVRQAAIHAGIVKPKITLQFDPDESGSQIAGKLYQKLTPEQFEALRRQMIDFKP